MGVWTRVHFELTFGDQPSNNGWSRAIALNGRSCPSEKTNGRTPGTAVVWTARDERDVHPARASLIAPLEDMPAKKEREKEEASSRLPRLVLLFHSFHSQNIPRRRPGQSSRLPSTTSPASPPSSSSSRRVLCALR